MVLLHLVMAPLHALGFFFFEPTDSAESPSIYLNLDSFITKHGKEMPIKGPRGLQETDSLHACSAHVAVKQFSTSVEEP